MKKNIVVCDRCGKEYSLDEWPTVEFHGVSDAHITMYATGPNQSSGTVDLCVNCRKSFRVWWKNKNMWSGDSEAE